MKSIYTATGVATGDGRSGHGATDDGRLDVDLAPPTAMGGDGEGTNPEQLFAVGYAACFHSALRLVAKGGGHDVTDSTVTAQVGIGKADEGPGYALAVTLEVSLPNVEGDAAREVVEQAHQVCPYSNATRGNVPVELVIV